MTCSSVQQHQTALYVEPGSSTYTFDSSSERWEYVTETLVQTGTLIDSQSTLGTRFPDVDQTRKGQTSVAGDILFEPTKTWFDSWLPRTLGANESTDVFNPAETLPSFAVLVDRVVEDRTFLDGYVNQLTVRGSVNQLIQATVNCMFLTSSTGTAPSVALSYSDAGDFPYTFQDATVTLGGTAYQMTEFELVINNNLKPRFVNATTATSICPGRSMVTLRVKLDVNATGITALHSTASTGIAGVLAFTNGIASTTWTFGKLVKPDSGFSVSQVDNPLDYDLTFTAKKDGATPIVSVTNEDAA